MVHIFENFDDINKVIIFNFFLNKSIESANCFLEIKI